MITRLVIRNFKKLKEADISLGQSVVFIGPNNSGKTTALQALALWDVGMRAWDAKRGEGKSSPEKRPGELLPMSKVTRYQKYEDAP
ncbi:MAG: AAA family ATPase [Deltaproteobacteria bacterium]